MSLEEVVLRASWNPAKSIRHEELGNLGIGSIADITILSQLNGNFGFVDAGGNRITDKHKLEAEMTIKAGKIVWDLNGLSARAWNR